MRATPHENERVIVDFYTASHDAARGAFQSFSLLVCPSDPGNGSTTGCVGPQAGVFSGKGGNDPSLDLLAGSPSGEVMLFGVFCSSGVPRLTTNGGESHAQCDGGVGQELSVRLAVGGPDNLQPLLPPEALLLDGAPFPADSSCGDSTPPIRADGASHEIGLRTALMGAEPEDVLVMTHLATHGTLDRLYTAPSGKDDASVTWKAPSGLGRTREDARFHFVLRDGRGGTAFLVKNICLEKGT
jgi:hypothetical protein